MLGKTKEIGIRLSIKDKEIAERALRAFGKEGQTALNAIQRAADPASVSLTALSASVGKARSAVSGFALGAVGALASMVSLHAILQKTKQALADFGDISDRSKSAGLNAEFFQEIVFGGQQAGLSIEEVSAALDTFNKNAGLAVVNKGRMVAQLKALNPELLENIRNATTQEARLRLAADAIDVARSASEKAALATTLFGDAGSRLVDVFRGGQAALDGYAERARALGIVIDQDLIARADELGDEFEIAQRVLDSQFKQAVINIAPFLVEAARAAGMLAEGLGLVVDAMQSIENKTTKGLENRLRDLGLESVRLENEILQIEADNKAWGNLEAVVGGINSSAVEGKQRRRAQIEAETAEITAILTNRETAAKPVATDTPTTPLRLDNAAGKKSLAEAEALIKRLRNGAEEYADTMSKLDQQLASGLIGQETYNRAMAEAVLKRAEAVKGDEDYAAALAKIEEALARGVITEQQYTDAIEDMSRRRLEAANTWQAGILLGLDSIAEESRHIGRNIEDSLVSGVERFEDAWIKAMETGKFEWGDLAKQILLDLARMATRQMITGPISGFLSGLFGGGGGGLRLGFQAGVGHAGATIGASPISRHVPMAMFANAPRHHAGTDFLKPGEVPFIGMRGEEIGWPDQLRRKYGGAGRGGDVTVNVNAVYNTEGSGLSPDQLSHVFEQNNKALIGKVVPVVRKAIRDGAL